MVAGDMSREDLMELVERFETLLSGRFEQLTIRERLCFRRADGVIFAVDMFPGEMALVIEYAEDYEEAMLYRFEDGDRFYPEDMDEEALFEAMLGEILS